MAHRPKLDGPEIKPGPNRQKGRWHIDITWPDGTRSRRLTSIPLDADPAAAVKAFETHILPGLMTQYEASHAKTATKAPKPGGRRQGPLLRDLAAWYLETHLPYVGAKPKTIEYYTSTLYNFITYAGSRHVARPAQLSSRIIQEWQLHNNEVKGRDRPSREQVLHVRRWLAVCQDCGELDELPNLTWHIPPKRKGKQHRAHDRETIAAWLDGLEAWRPKVALVARWVYGTGWRIGDVLDFRIGEIDRRNHWIDREQIKTSEALPYPLTPALEALLEQALKGRSKPARDAYVFLNHKRRPWTYRQIYRVLVNYNEAHWDGDDITFRDLRKSFGTHLAMDGCPPNVLKELMGHSDITMTLSYYVQVDQASMRQWSERHTRSKKDRHTP